MPHGSPHSTYPAAYGQPVKTGFLGRLSPAKRAGVLIGGGLAALLVVCCGGSSIVAALSGNSSSGTSSARGGGQASAAVDADGVKAPVGGAGAAEVPTSQPVATTQPAPVVEVKTVTETQAVPFTEKTVSDASLPKGTRKVTVPGVAGSKTVTYTVTYTDGVETGRTKVSETVTKQPKTQVTSVGTKVAAPASQCDPNYSGACVPIASDVDCAGGSGDGPAYVKGPVYVIGKDIYGLDRDGDGVACE